MRLRPVRMAKSTMCADVKNEIAFQLNSIFY